MMRRLERLRLLVLGLGLFLSACRTALPATQPVTAQPSPSPIFNTPIASTQAVMATLNTPQPPTLTLTSTSPPLTPTSVLTPTATLPPPAPLLRLPPEIEVVLLLGTDYVSPYAGRTDTILLAFLNPATGGVSLVSIPRDLYVFIPGLGMERINVAYGKGGIDLLHQTLEYNLGIKPSRWALSHLDDFVRFVDDLGGVDIQNFHALPNDCGGIGEGFVHLYGEQALCYVRERRTSSDFERVVRQQEVLKALLLKFITLDNLRQLPEWYSRYQDTVRTDVTLTDLLLHVPLAFRLKTGAGFHTFQIGREEVEGYQVEDTNASVLLPKRDAITQKLQAALEALLVPIPTPMDLPDLLARLTATPTQTPLPPTDTPQPEPAQELPPEAPSELLDTPTPEPAEPTATPTATVFQGFSSQ